ncbi:Uncharacterized protein TCM_036445 [Theobroma cacao]|uniref:DUF4283 domain-containing protein n=1 Tax=Theobroma cacao TaxID=3641 RepID=A0A061FKU6_THECC|nr:Uncharacterized protein TCM_036445 [Theobroma cacao]
MKGHSSKLLVELYQALLQDQGKYIKTNFVEDDSQVDITQLDVADFFAQLERQIDHLIVATGEKTALIPLHREPLWYTDRPAVSFFEDEISALAQRFKFSMVGKFSRMPRMQEIRATFKRIGLMGAYEIRWLDYKHILILLTNEHDLNRIWLNQTLLAIAKMVGRSLMVDEATTNGTCPSVVRVCIEYDCQKPIIDHVWIVTRDRQTGLVKGGYMQIVEFAWLQENCTHCYHVGHGVASCMVMGHRPKKKLLLMGVRKQIKGNGNDRKNHRDGDPKNKEGNRIDKVQVELAKQNEKWQVVSRPGPSAVKDSRGEKQAEKENNTHAGKKVVAGLSNVEENPSDKNVDEDSRTKKAHALSGETTTNTAKLQVREGDKCDGHVHGAQIPSEMHANRKEIETTMPIEDVKTPAAGGSTPNLSFYVHGAFNHTNQVIGVKTKKTGTTEVEGTSQNEPLNEVTGQNSTKNNQKKKAEPSFHKEGRQSEEDVLERGIPIVRGKMTSTTAMDQSARRQSQRDPLREGMEKMKIDLIAVKGHETAGRNASQASLGEKDKNYSMGSDVRTNVESKVWAVAFVQGEIQQMPEHGPADQNVLEEMLEGSGEHSPIDGQGTSQIRGIDDHQQIVSSEASSRERIEGHANTPPTQESASASDKAMDMGKNDEDSDEDAISVNFAASWERERYF